MSKSIRAILTLAAATMAVTGCASVNKAMGGGKNPPDEFAIVTKAPLTLPPDYALRPPRPGESRPQEKSPSERARQLMLGDETAAAPTNGELAFVQEAGALSVDPNIRAILAAENGGWAEKDSSLANRVLFWQVKDGAIDDEMAPLRVDDPEAWPAGRRKSIENVTGGEEVVISKDNKILNLPGVR